ncbi:MAG TPA: transposase [Planctomycetota bacterium]|nr:transposase [Planctomycetota bacterium]
MNLLSNNFHCRCLLKSIRAACEKDRIDLCAYVFMPDHVHMLILPQAAEHDIAAFERSVQNDFSKQVLAEHHERALRRFRVREKSGVRGYRFWQAGRPFDEIVKSPKAAIAKMRFCEGDPVQQGLPSTSASWRWTNFITDAQLSDKWAELQSCQTASLNSEAPTN